MTSHCTWHTMFSILIIVIQIVCGHCGVGASIVLADCDVIYDVIDISGWFGDVTTFSWKNIAFDCISAIAQYQLITISNLDMQLSWLWRHQWRPIARDIPAMFLDISDSDTDLMRVLVLLISPTMYVFVISLVTIWCGQLEWWRPR